MEKMTEAGLEFFGVDKKFQLDPAIRRRYKTKVEDNRPSNEKQFMIKIKKADESSMLSGRSAVSMYNKMPEPVVVEADDEELRRPSLMKLHKQQITLEPESHLSDKIPYDKSLEVLRILPKIGSLNQKRSVLQYVWSKLQTEVYEFWENREIP